MDQVIQKLIKTRKFNVARHYADVLPAAQRKEELMRIRAACVANGDWKQAVKIAKLMGDKLDTQERKILFDIHLASFWADHYSVKHKVVTEADYIDATSHLIRATLKIGYLYQLEEVLILAGDKIKPEDAKDALEACLVDGSLSYAQELARLEDRDLTADELLRIFNHDMREKDPWLMTAAKTAMLLPDLLRKNCLRKVLKKCIALGELHNAEDVAAMLGRSLSKAELEKLLKHAVAKGDLAWALRLAKKLGRKLLPEELATMFEYNVKRECLMIAEEVLKLMTKTQRKQELVKLLRVGVMEEKLSSDIVEKLAKRLSKIKGDKQKLD